MFFRVVDRQRNAEATQFPQCIVVTNDWDDWFTYETLHSLILFASADARIDVGFVKIARRGQGRHPEVPTEFEALGDDFFSLGQDENYYETLAGVDADLRDRILVGLRDCAFDLSIFESAATEDVMTQSLLRSVPSSNVTTRLHRLAVGDASLTPFHFHYEFPRGSQGAAEPVVVSFHVIPESLPPTNVHVLVGRNGVGKTRCLTFMAHALIQPVQPEPPAQLDYGRLRLDDGSESWNFVNLVSVAFSAFDAFELPAAETAGMRYSYVGLRQRPRTSTAKRGPPPKTPEELGTEFVESVSQCRVGARRERWRRALETLEADPLFEEADVKALADVRGAEANAEAKVLFERLSSGHKIVLLSITRLVELTDERTLILLDEPEGHLHPPLLSAFVRALSDLLTKRNGVAIVATHSPVVLQEVPKSCVWILRRSGGTARANRPTIETFGENVGVLTREVFGLEVTHSGFHKLLEASITHSVNYDDVIQRFANQLGGEARALARILTSADDDPDESGK